MTTGQRILVAVLIGLGAVFALGPTLLCLLVKVS